jgi:hypothetical protein
MQKARCQLSGLFASVCLLHQRVADADHIHRDHRDQAGHQQDSRTPASWLNELPN